MQKARWSNLAGFVVCDAGIRTQADRRIGSSRPVNPLDLVTLQPLGHIAKFIPHQTRTCVGMLFSLQAPRELGEGDATPSSHSGVGRACCSWKRKSPALGEAGRSSCVRLWGVFALGSIHYSIKVQQSVSLLQLPNLQAVVAGGG